MDREEKDIQAIRFFDAEGGVLTSSTNPDVTCHLPEGALTVTRKNFCKVSIQVLEIEKHIVQEYLGKGSFLSPIIAIEPVRRKFHQALTLSIPLPQIGGDAIDVRNLRMLFSMGTTGLEKLCWDDITYLVPDLQQAATENNSPIRQGRFNLVLNITGYCAVVYCQDSIRDVAATMTEMFQTIMMAAYSDVSDDSTGAASLLQGARLGKVAVVTRCLENKAVNIDSQNKEGQTALHLAAKEGHCDVIEELLKKGADTNLLTKRGNAALHLACYHGNTDVVKLMLDNGCDVNVPSKAGFPPLYPAILELHCDIVTLLLSHQADYTWITPDGLSLLLVGVFSKFDKDKTMALMNVLLEHCDLQRFVISDAMKARRFVCHNEALLQCVGSRQSTRELIPTIREHLATAAASHLQVELNSVENVSDKLKRFLKAIHDGNVDEVISLISDGVDVNAATEQGVAAIHCCCLYGHNAILIRLLEAGSKPDSKTQSGFTPLYLAAQEGYPDVVKTLLKTGLDTKSINQYGLCAQDIAKELGHTEIVTAIRDAKKPTTLFEGKVMLRKTDSVKKEKTDSVTAVKEKSEDSRRSCSVS